MAIVAIGVISNVSADNSGNASLADNVETDVSSHYHDLTAVGGCCDHFDDDFSENETQTPDEIQISQSESHGDDKALKVKAANRNGAAGDGKKVVSSMDFKSNNIKNAQSVTQKNSFGACEVNEHSHDEISNSKTETTIIMVKLFLKFYNDANAKNSIIMVILKELMNFEWVS